MPSKSKKQNSSPDGIDQKSSVNTPLLSFHLPPRFVAILILFSILGFGLGYGAYYANKLRQFWLNISSQHVSTTSHSATQMTVPSQLNILLLGSDNDQKFTGNPLTQTMMVVHIDTQKQLVTLFSIPRDLWVKLPDTNTFGKIDQAAGYGGIPSAITVVEQTFGIHIDHYAWVGLLGFIKSINAVGGVNLDALRPVLDNAYPTDINSPNPYGIQRLSVQAGMQHFSGEEVLQYVRSRHEDVSGDFGRTQRQRQLLLTLKDQLLHQENILTELPVILESLNDQVKTDVDPLAVFQFGYAFLTHHQFAVQQFSLSPPTYSRIGTSVDGQDIVIGNANTVSELVKNIFGDTAAKTTLQSLTNVGQIKS